MAVDIKSTQDVMVVGAPGGQSNGLPTKNTNGAVFVYKQQSDTSWAVIDSIIPDDSHALEFGHTVRYNDLDFVAIGAPGTNSNKGVVYIGSCNSNAIGLTQVLNVGSIADLARYGQAVAVSRNGDYIAV